MNLDRNGYYKVNESNELDLIGDLIHFKSNIKRPPLAYHIITEGDIGNFDRIAYRYYGKGYEKLYWAILVANDILDQYDKDLTGKTIQIPDIRDIYDFYSEYYGSDKEFFIEE